MDVDVREDNTKQVLDAFSAAIMKGLEQIGEDAEGNAKELCPVDTGLLRNRITHVLDEGGKKVYIGTNVEYAEAVEMNEKAHHSVGQAHYLRDGARMDAGQYSDILKNALSNA